MNSQEGYIMITRHEEFEMAHILPNHSAGCGRLHGHSYKIEVTVTGPQTGPWDMIMDFGLLKQAIKRNIPDHYFSYNCLEESDIVSQEIHEVLKKHGIEDNKMFCMTTAENMVKYFAQIIDDYIKKELELPNIDVIKVDLWETSNSHATWLKDMKYLTLS